jgi:transketolase
MSLGEPLHTSTAERGDRGPLAALPGKSSLDGSSPSGRGVAWRQRARLRLLRMHFESRVGHLGGNFSALDVLLALFHDVMTADDQFVLSKGHAAGALYIVLWTLGRLTDGDLEQFHRDGTRLSGHPPPHGIDEIPFATGSLGHGLGLAAGLALGKRLQQRPGHVFCLTSDGEWNEGSTWESLIFSHQQRLSNLTVVVDCNGLQGFGTTREVADLAPLADKLTAFGVQTLEIDGHDARAIIAALQTHAGDGPRFIVAQTHKGCGVSFMQDRMEWHYLPLTAEQYAQAVQEVTAS